MPTSSLYDKLGRKLEKRRAKQRARQRADDLAMDREKFGRPTEDFREVDPSDMEPASSGMESDMMSDSSLSSVRDRFESGLEQAGEAADAVGDLADAIDGGSTSGSPQGRVVSDSEADTVLVGGSMGSMGMDDDVLVGGEDSTDYDDDVLIG